MNVDKNEFKLKSKQSETASFVAANKKTYCLLENVNVEIIKRKNDTHSKNKRAMKWSSKQVRAAFFFVFPRLD